MRRWLGAEGQRALSVIKPRAKRKPSRRGRLGRWRFALEVDRIRRRAKGGITRMLTDLCSGGHWAAGALKRTYNSERVSAVVDRFENDLATRRIVPGQEQRAVRETAGEIIGILNEEGFFEKGARGFFRD